MKLQSPALAILSLSRREAPDVLAVAYEGIPARRFFHVIDDQEIDGPLVGRSFKPVMRQNGGEVLGL